MGADIQIHQINNRKYPCCRLFFPGLNLFLSPAFYKIFIACQLQTMVGMLRTSRQLVLQVNFQQLPSFLSGSGRHCLSLTFRFCGLDNYDYPSFLKEWMLFTADYTSYISPSSFSCIHLDGEKDTGQVEDAVTTRQPRLSNLHGIIWQSSHDICVLMYEP